MMRIRESVPVVTLVFESLFGSTLLVAEAIADGIRERLPVETMSVGSARGVTDCDLLVIGAPTHARSLSTAASRAEAARWAQDPARRLTPLADTGAIGVREWIDGDVSSRLGCVAFDTRVDMPRILTGSAASAIERRLKRKGMPPLLPSESFLVDRSGRLLTYEVERARRFGRDIAMTATDRSHRIA